MTRSNNISKWKLAGLLSIGLGSGLYGETKSQVVRSISSPINHNSRCGASRQIGLVSSITPSYTMAKVLPNPAVIYLPDGGYKQVFKTSTGVVYNLVTPPNFNAKTASSEQLKTYGFPPKPTDPLGAQQWDNEWGSITLTPSRSIQEEVPVTATGGLQLQAYKGPSSRQASSLGNSTIRNTVENSTAGQNWGGFYASATSSYPQGEMYDVSAETVIGKTKSSSCYPTAVSNWIGLYDLHDRGLMQEGMLQQDGGPSAPFTEVLSNSDPAGPKFPSFSNGCTPSANDIMALNVSFSYNGAYSGVSFIMHDESKLGCSSSTVDVLGTNAKNYYNLTGSYTNEVAVWMVEAPCESNCGQSNQQEFPLADFGKSTFSETRAYFSKWGGPNQSQSLPYIKFGDLGFYSHYQSLGTMQIQPGSNVLATLSPNSYSNPSAFPSSGSGWFDDRFSENWSACS